LKNWSKGRAEKTQIINHLNRGSISFNMCAIVSPTADFPHIQPKVGVGFNPAETKYAREMGSLAKIGMTIKYK